MNTQKIVKIMSNTNANSHIELLEIPPHTQNQTSSAYSFWIQTAHCISFYHSIYKNPTVIHYFQHFAIIILLLKETPHKKNKKILTKNAFFILVYYEDHHN